MLYPQSMAGSNPDPQIGGILPQQRVDALELVFSHLQPDERQRQIGEALVEMSLPANGPFEGLIGARRNGRLVGAMFSQIAPGRTAIVWLPRLVAGEPEATAARLYAATWEFLARQRIVLAQVLLSMVGKVERAALRLGGFRHLANLFYLVSRDDASFLPRRQSRNLTSSRILPPVVTNGRKFSAPLASTRSIVRAWKTCGLPKTCWRDTVRAACSIPTYGCWRGIGSVPWVAFCWPITRGTTTWNCFTWG